MESIRGDAYHRWEPSRKALELPVAPVSLEPKISVERCVREDSRWQRSGTGSQRALSEYAAVQAQGEGHEERDHVWRLDVYV